MKSGFTAVPPALLELRGSTFRLGLHLLRNRDNSSGSAWAHPHHLKIPKSSFFDAARRLEVSLGIKFHAEKKDRGRYFFTVPAIEGARVKASAWDALLGLPEPLLRGALALVGFRYAPTTEELREALGVRKAEACRILRELRNSGMSWSAVQAEIAARVKPSNRANSGSHAGRPSNPANLADSGSQCGCPSLGFSRNSGSASGLIVSIGVNTPKRSQSTAAPATDSSLTRIREECRLRMEELRRRGRRIEHPDRYLRVSIAQWDGTYRATEAEERRRRHAAQAARPVEQYRDAAIAPDERVQISQYVQTELRAQWAALGIL